MAAGHAIPKSPLTAVTQSSGTGTHTRTASVAEAKAGLSSLLREVEQRRTEITLVRRGIPVARLVPLEPMKAVAGYGWMRGTVVELGDIVGPSGEEWDVNDEDYA